MIKLKSVDDALNELVDTMQSPSPGALVSFRIQDIAKKMHYQCWRYRDLILTEIHEWAEQHHHNSIWTDAHSRVFKIGYQYQNPPAAFGSFSRRGSEDILMLVLQEHQSAGGEETNEL